MVTDPAKPRCILLKRRAILNRIVLSISQLRYDVYHDPTSAASIVAPARESATRDTSRRRHSVAWASQGMQEPELARRRELPVGAEARLGVLDLVQG